MKRIITPWASSGTKNTIPDAAVVPDVGVASYPIGFTPLNATPLTAGGVPVSEGDMNGVLNDVTDILSQNAQGIYFTYDSSYATAISGYPVNAVLAKSGAIGHWLNITAGNTANPDTGGAGWIDFSPKAIQNNSLNHATAAGTADAITATYSPAYAAWADGMTFFVKITAANTTTTPTVSTNGLAAKTIVFGNGIAVKANMLSVGMIAEFKYSSTLDKVLLQNPNLTGGLLNVQTFKTAGAFTYTPTPGTKYYIVDVCGGGGGGGGSSNCTGTQASVGAGGMSGAYGKGIYFPASPAATVAVTVGSAGVGGTVGVGPATAGGTSSFGALLSATGGAGATNGSAYVPPSYGDSFASGASTVMGSNILSIDSQYATLGASLSTTMIGKNGGANSQFGQGGRTSLSSGGSVAGVVGTGNGSGGGGAVTTASGTAKTGGNGTPGIVIVWEYM